MPKLKLLPDIPKINTTPLAEVNIGEGRVSVDLDDQDENRIRLVFAPFQSVRVTTSDCFLPPHGTEIIIGSVVEVQGSSWIAELRETLAKVDGDADFMKRARHFLVPAQDDFIEIVSWDIRLEAPS